MPLRAAADQGVNLLDRRGNRRPASALAFFIVGAHSLASFHQPSLQRCVEVAR
jgi:hypothetical protein